MLVYSRDLLNLALREVKKSCRGKGLSINPLKATLVPFTRKCELEPKPPTIVEKEIGVAESVKYLDQLDQRLTKGNTSSKFEQSFSSSGVLLGFWVLEPVFNSISTKKLS